MLVVFQDGYYYFKRWRCIQVGEMFKIYVNEVVLCDMVLFGISDLLGVVYVEIFNFDGEFNLKSRYVRQEIVD